MVFRAVVILCVAAAANAGLLSPVASIASPALAYGAAAPQLGTTYHGNIVSPALAAPAVSVAAPALSYAAPAVSYASPALSYAAPAVAAPAVSYASPALSYAAPAVSYASPAIGYAPTAIHTPAITSQSSNILRSFGNLGQVSTYTKTIDTPFSSVRKADVRVSNPGLRVGVAAAPALVAAQPAAIGVAYSAAPAVSHISYASNYVNYGW